MIKKTLLTLWFLLLMVMILSPTVIDASNNDTNDDPEENRTAVYFYHPFCSSCETLENDGAIERLEASGVEVTRYDTSTSLGRRMFRAYTDVYEVPRTARQVPILFVGENYYNGQRVIRNAIDNNTVFETSSAPLIDVLNYIPPETTFISALFTAVLYGLLDGINPCAIAMLLMFISMIKFTDNKRALVTVSLSYIGAVFVTYFAIMAGVLTVLSRFMQTFIHLSYGLYIAFAILFLLLFIVTFYDYLVTRSERYEKIKNQLPKFIQTFNKRVMERLTTIINEEEGGVKQALLIVLIPFLIGVIVGFTEAACTGQIMLAYVTTLDITVPGIGVSGVRLFLLLIFNIMFILPLLIIAIAAIRSKNVMAVSNFVREHLSTIKLVTAIFFLLMVVYFTFLFFDTDLILMLFDSIRNLFI